jgi:hypothetical protein
MGYDWAKWVRHKIEKGEAIVRPVGYHKGVERLQGFRSRLDACRDIEELEGFANRRKFNPALPRWNASERDAILRRKFEMENNGNERRKKK